MNFISRFTCAALLFGSSNFAYSDEALKLEPPATSTKESRTRDMTGCFAVSKEIVQYADVVPPFEASPLLGQNTGRFVGGGRPSVDDEAIPTRYGTATGINWGQSAVTDRYVLCLLALAYKWPNLTAPASPPTSELPASRESTLLYDAGGIYRQRGAHKEAIRLLVRSLELEERLSEPGSAKITRRLAELAAAHFQLGQYDDGLPYVKKLAPKANDLPSRDKEFILVIFDSYAKELRKRGIDADASKLEAKSTELR